MKRIIGFYLIGIGVAFFMARMIEGLNMFYFLFVFGGTWIIALLLFARMIQRCTRLALWLQWIIKIIFACITAWCAAVASLFNPLAVRPSPIPLSDKTLDAILGSVNVFLILIGLLFIRRKILEKMPGI